MGLSCYVSGGWSPPLLVAMARAFAALSTSFRQSSVVRVRRGGTATRRRRRARSIGSSAFPWKPFSRSTRISTRQVITKESAPTSSSTSSASMARIGWSPPFPSEHSTTRPRRSQARRGSRVREPTRRVQGLSRQASRSTADAGRSAERVRATSWTATTVCWRPSCVVTARFGCSCRRQNMSSFGQMQRRSFRQGGILAVMYNR